MLRHSARSVTHALQGAWAHAGASTSGREFSSQAGGAFVARLASRGVISMEGDESIDFLQGMVTNDVTPLHQPGAPPVYAAIMTPKGKFLHDLFIYRAPGEALRLLLDVGAAGRDHTTRLLQRYKLRRHITIGEPLAPGQAVWARWGEGAASGTSSNGGWWSDPRLAQQLGERGVFPADQELPGGCAAGVQLVGEREYRRLRYSLGVPEGDTEIPAEKANPLEYNLDELHGVSYTKGCYVGQERNSFTHYRGVIRKRLMPITLQGDVAGVAAGAEVLEGEGGRSIGIITGVEGDTGIAQLKLLPALAATASCTGLPVAGVPGVRVLPVRPAWWQPSWGTEETEAAS